VQKSTENRRSKREFWGKTYSFGRVKSAFLLPQNPKNPSEGFSLELLVKFFLSDFVNRNFYLPLLWGNEDALLLSLKFVLFYNFVRAS
jgi:hypothetical protein